MRKLLLLLLVSCTGSGPITAAGESVYAPSTETMVFENRGGGFGQQPPQGPCDPNKSSFTLDVGSQHLAWTLCDIVDTQPPTTAVRAGDRDLTADEWLGLEPVLEGLVIDDTMQYGADKPILALTVTTPDWTQEYGDAFYNCPGSDPGPRIKTEALDALQSAFRSLSN